MLEAIFKGREQHGRFDHVRVRGAHLVVSRDGTTSLSSKPIHGPHCLPRHLTNGPTRYDPTAIPPGRVCPGRPDIIAVPPEDSRPQDGEATQAGEQQAGTRWLSKQAQAVAPQQMPLLGDALSSQPPFGALAQHQGWHCILPCQPAAHLQFYTRWAFWQANDGMAERAGRAGNGRCRAVTRSRYGPAVRLRGGDDAVSVHGGESTGGHAQPGEQLEHHSCITNHRLRADNLAAVAHGGRGRWKIENEHTNGLKPKGDHLEPQV